MEKQQLKSKMTYKEYYKLNNKFITALKLYVVDRNTETDEYYTAVNLLTEMSEKAYIDKGFCSIAGKWLDGGSTLELKEALRYTSYNENILYSNAMCLMDAVSCSLKPTIKPN
jgi:hypothetical protein